MKLERFYGVSVMRRTSSKTLSTLLAAALFFVAAAEPAAAGKRTVQAQERAPASGIQNVKGEVLIIEGQPVLVLEAPEGNGLDEEYLSIPLPLGETTPAFLDGRAAQLKVEDNAVLVPTRKGIVAVPIEEFCFVADDGEMALVAKEAGVTVRIETVGNPVPLIVKVAAAILGISAILVFPDWLRGECGCTRCDRWTDGPRGDVFCGHRLCLAPSWP